MFTPAIRPSFSERILAPYRRITSSGQFIPEIDGLRFVAIFLVYIYHVSGDILRHSTAAARLSYDGHWLFSVTHILNIGVPLFFVISGFILGMPFAAAHLAGRPPVSLKKYFLRRVTRLEPPYILALLLFFVLKVAAARGTAHELLPNLLASVFYVHNLVYGSPSVIDFVAWSLEIEVQFYILAPLLALVFAVADAGLRRSLLALSILAATALSVATPQALSLSLLSYAQYFLAGFLLVDLYLAGGLRRQGSWLWDLVSTAGWPLLLALLVTGGAAAGWVAPWLLALLFLAAFRGQAVNRIVTNAWIATIGGMCYSIYLLHNYIVAAIGPLTERMFSGYPFPARLLVQLVLMSPVVLGISALYFRWVERPCMRPDWPRRMKAWFGHLRLRGYLTPAAVSAARASSDE